jgi:hypothetical protein
VNGVILSFGGICIIPLGLRVVGTKVGENHVHDEWHARYSTTFRISGACEFDVGIFLDL